MKRAYILCFIALIFVLFFCIKKDPLRTELPVIHRLKMMPISPTMRCQSFSGVLSSVAERVSREWPAEKSRLVIDYNAFDIKIDPNCAAYAKDADVLVNLFKDRLARDPIDVDPGSVFVQGSRGDNLWEYLVMLRRCSFLDVDVKLDKLYLGCRKKLYICHGLPLDQSNGVSKIKSRPIGTDDGGDFVTYGWKLIESNNVLLVIEPWPPSLTNVVQFTGE